ncbi:hypothetical protein B0H34DRAFT_681296 [Crassisporium funariophilum]|nr:hypothetical protein B0H34DRAFT_681296 [Crassisporium funariophilum]
MVVTRAESIQRDFWAIPLFLRRHALLIVAFLTSAEIYRWYFAGVVPYPYDSTHCYQHTRYGICPYPEPQDIPPRIQRTGMPPLYEAYMDFENHLTKQVEGNTPTRKYIYFANHVASCGWGNVLQETVFSSLVASGLDRGFVFDDYIVEFNTKPYSRSYNGKYYPTIIPHSAMINGYLVGLDSSGLNRNDNNETLAIPRRVYERICPPSERVYIHLKSVEAHLRRVTSNPKASLDDASGKSILDAWLSRLSQPDVKDAPCVQVLHESPNMFNIVFFGTTAMQDLWETLSTSPVLTNWAWSPLVYRALDQNRRLFMPVSKQSVETSPLSTDIPPWHISWINTAAPLPVLTLHLRRGDFKEHCPHLADMASNYTGFATFPEFSARDPFVVPRLVHEHWYSHPLSLLSKDSTARGSSENIPIVESREELHRYYAPHCYPDVKQIVQRVREVLHDYETFVRGADIGIENGLSFERAKAEEERDRTVPDSSQESRGIAGWKQEAEDIGNSRALSRSLANQSLRRIFIMSNGNSAFLKEVKDALLEDAANSRNQEKSAAWKFQWEWEVVSTSRDLVLGWEEAPVGRAIDTYVAHRSELFLGNGFSSLTGNVVMLRKMGPFDPVQTRFW